MFLKIEGNELINLTLISRVELLHSKKVAIMWNAGVYEKESHIAYAYFMNKANDKFLYVEGQ